MIRELSISFFECVIILQFAEMAKHCKVVFIDCMFAMFAVAENEKDSNDFFFKAFSLYLE